MLKFKYRDLENKSSVDRYEYGDSYIKVQFKPEKIGVLVYKYTTYSMNIEYLNEMKRLADIGKGLNSYIVKNAHKGFVKHESKRYL